MGSTLIVFLGAGIGGAARHLANLAVTRWLGDGFPWGILTINVAGSLAMGLVAGWFATFAADHWSQPVRLFLATGMLGGFTTFSAFSLDVVLLMERHDWVGATLYALGSVALSILACLAGLWLMRSAA
jgi:CrcB protein